MNERQLEDLAFTVRQALDSLAYCEGTEVEERILYHVREAVRQREKDWLAYTAFLEKEVSGLSSFALVHGNPTSQEVVEEGIRLRRVLGFDS